MGSWDIGPVPPTTVLRAQIQTRHRLSAGQGHGQLQLCVPLVATSGDRYLATNGDFFMATDTGIGPFEGVNVVNQAGELRCDF